MLDYFIFNKPPFILVAIELNSKAMSAMFAKEKTMGFSKSKKRNKALSIDTHDARTATKGKRGQGIIIGEHIPQSLEIMTSPLPGSSSQPPVPSCSRELKNRAIDNSTQSEPKGVALGHIDHIM